MLLRAALVTGLLLAGVSRLGAEEPTWPQFRGPDGQGNVVGTAPLEWSEQQGVRWKTPLPGRGWSSPVVEGNQIWMTTAIEKQGDRSKIERVGGTPAGQLDQASALSLRAICVDRRSGELVHDVELVHVENPNPIHALNSYASPTPVVEQGKLYCHFGRYGTVCLDTQTLDIVWRRVFEIEHYVGPGSSPVMCDDLLVLTCDGADKQFIVAVDKQTGKTAWQQDRPPLRSTNPDTCKSYCTPLVVENDGTKQIVIPGAQWIIAYAPEDGHEIWRHDHGSGFSIVPRPVVDDDHVYCCTGFGSTKLLAIPYKSEGDVSDADWVHSKQVPTQPSPLLHEGRLYLVSDNGIGQCIDTATQKVLWKQRMPGNYSASILRVDNRLYYFSREGVTTVIDANSPKGDELATNQLDGSHMATPAVVDGEFIVRTATHLYAIGQ
ncbi:outer membrane protein assembly factor BamB family protein [Aeoliella mucimassa]|uniref:Outer membrane biogenesis protein BamB n=1 Tax=Aeoliella mucimassa TaxID=2527972 RepID=A0A518ARD0_9BACT|nr:PQQ-binding-like beta-propeller repeat protein [Aeoliella mucimassa]QDU57272.1 outer membrane biogenesis protein BamB [Aeoliella mucimassa]